MCSQQPKLYFVVVVSSLGIVLWEIATRKKPFDGVYWINADGAFQSLHNELYQSSFQFSLFIITISPVTDCSTDQEICKRVCEDKLGEPLPEDCPKQLRELINACRSYDSFHRPTAGGNSVLDGSKM